MILSIRIYILLACMPFALYSQHEGDQWIIGYNSGGSPDYSIMHIDFSQDKPTGISVQIDPCFPLVIDPPTDTSFFIRFQSVI